MAEIWLFNAIAKRRRSAGDTFLENGLAALRGHLEGEGHRARLFDWATEGEYRRITPGWLARINRTIAGRLIAWKDAGRTGFLFKALFAASLLTQGLQDRILERRMDRRLRALAGQAARVGVRLFGVKVWYGEAFEWAERLCRHLHELSPGTVVIAGGHQPTLYEEEFFKRTSFDLAVTSQGELPMTRLMALADELEKAGSFSREEFVRRAAELAGKGEIKNLMYRASSAGGRRMAVGGSSVGAVPPPTAYCLPPTGDEVRKTARYPRLNGGVHLPAYEISGDEKVLIHVVIESLGCTWGQCHFCVHRQFYDGFQPRGVESIVREMEHLRSLGVGIFRFAGSDTPPDLGRTIGQAILDRKIVTEFGMGSRGLKGIERPEVYRGAVEAYEVLIRAGLRAVFMGGETGDPWVNDEVMNKGLHPDEIVATVRALREAEKNMGQHVDVGLALIYPTPTLGKITHEKVFDADIALVKAVAPDSAMITPPGPFRNTRWNLEAEKFGFQLAPDWVDRLIRYEYVLYKPPFMWKEMPLTFENRPYMDALELCGKLRVAVAGLGVPTDLSDEHFLMLRAAGFEGKEGANRFKDLTSLDIVSGDYRNIRGIAARVNAHSRELAARRS